MPISLSRRRFLVGTAGAVAAAALGDWFLIEPVSIDVRRDDVPIRGLPRELDGFRIACITDVHLHGIINGATRATLQPPARQRPLLAPRRHTGSTNVSRVSGWCTRRATWTRSSRAWCRVPPRSSPATPTAARYVFRFIRRTRRTAAVGSSPGGTVTHWRRCTCRAASGPCCSRRGCFVLRSCRSLRCGRWIRRLEDRRGAIGESEARELRDLREQASRQPCGGQERAALGAQRAFGRRPIGGNGCVTTCAEHGRVWCRQYCLQVWGRGPPPAAGDRPAPERRNPATRL